MIIFSMYKINNKYNKIKTVKLKMVIFDKIEKYIWAKWRKEKQPSFDDCFHFGPRGRI